MGSYKVELSIYPSGENDIRWSMMYAEGKTDNFREMIKVNVAKIANENNFKMINFLRKSCKINKHMFLFYCTRLAGERAVIKEFVHELECYIIESIGFSCSIDYRDSLDPNTDMFLNTCNNV